MKGFTLIELVVSIAIGLFLTGLIIANYNSYNDIQVLKQAALTLKNNFRFAQSKAMSGDKPSQCTQLSGYSVTFTDASDYSIQALCAPEGLAGASQKVTLPGGVILSPQPGAITFNVLSRGTTLDAPVTITLAGFGKQYDLVVNPSGDVSDLGLQ